MTTSTSTASKLTIFSTVEIAETFNLNPYMTEVASNCLRIENRFAMNIKEAIRVMKLLIFFGKITHDDMVEFLRLKYELEYSNFLQVEVSEMEEHLNLPDRSLYNWLEMYYLINDKNLDKSTCTVLDVAIFCCMMDELSADRIENVMKIK